MSSSHLAKISSLTILAISISACSSNNHSTQNISSPIPQQPTADKAAADKAAADKAAADKAAADKAAADKAAADKAAADKAEISSAKGISDATYPIGEITSYATGQSSSSINNRTTGTITGITAYNQKYSIVLGDTSSTADYNNSTGYIYSSESRMDLSTKGLKTTVDNIPSTGTATYNGRAFSAEDSTNYGVLNYTVDFSQHSGSGSINFPENISLDSKIINNQLSSSVSGKTISLEKGLISNAGISSTAKISGTTTKFSITSGENIVQAVDKTGTYSLGFYGKNAEEVAGKASFDGKDAVGFGGTRGEITK